MKISSKYRPSLTIIFSCSLVYFLLQISQIAVTPIGEGLDFYAHWSYIMFLSDQGRPPLPQEKSIPEHIVKIQEYLPGPDFGNSRKYRHWAELTPEDKNGIKKKYMQPAKKLHYTETNHQAQHPPLYYRLAGNIYRLTKQHTFDFQRYIMSLFSVIITAAAIPAVYGIFRTLFTRRQSLMLLLCFAWYPNLMPFLGRVTNDSLAFTLITYAVWAALQRPQRLPHSVICGISLVLCFFTKTYGLALAPACLACSAIDFNGKVIPHVRWKNFIILSAILGIGAMGLFAFNYINTGYIIVLTESRGTAGISLLQKLNGIFHISPIWFLAGLAKGFLWCGYWSFVSPGAIYYTPLLAPIIVLIYKPISMIRNGTFLNTGRLWMHYLLLSFFMLGMLWHANLFTLRANLLHQTIHSGNEGWYMNVILPSVITCIFYLIKNRFNNLQFERILIGSLFLTMLWNLIARLAMYSFWTGQVSITGRLRAVDWHEAFNVLSAKSYQSWLSCPGIMHPIWLTSIIPGVTAAIISFIIVIKLCKSQSSDINYA